LLAAILCTWGGFAAAGLAFAGMAGDEFLFSSGGCCVIAGKIPPQSEIAMATAVRFTDRTGADGFPAAGAWEKAPGIRFRSDWQGKNADPQLETEVRLLWTTNALYLRFAAHFRSITVFADAEPDGRRDELWNRDVAEVFLQPDGFQGRRYKEIEVSPNGFWIDLDIAPRKKHDLKSGLKRRASVDEEFKVWTAEVILPMKSLTAHFDPAKAWRVNFFRVEGAAEPRFYSAWRPTGTPVPNFHVPEAFGKLIFEK
jgi:alpha-galactosidase